MARLVDTVRDEQPTLVLFARDPTAAPVKTRLASAIGVDAAAELYAAFVADLARRFRDVPHRVRWALAPPVRDFARRFGVAPEACLLQSGADLGARMHAAFAACTRGGAGCAVVGTDMPHLGADAVARAFARLADHDLVIGPAEDGGYYLIAMRSAHDVFSGVAWSSAAVLEQTLERARVLGLRVDLLEPGFDVDTAEDLERLARLVSRGALGDVRETEAALRRLRLGGPR